ncbi:Mur ligase domain-containing protein, partial [Escherichia coli]
MISVTLSQLTDILNGELQGADITLDAVTTDTRKLTPGCLFVALKGERFDAHDFADQAKAGGAGALLVSRPLDIDLKQTMAMGCWSEQELVGEQGHWQAKKLTTDASEWEVLLDGE